MQAVANGHTFLVFKDNAVRKIPNGDMEKVVTVSNNILGSRQVGHQAAKTAAVEEKTFPAFNPDAHISDDSDDNDSDSEGEDEDDSENEDSSSEDESNGSGSPKQPATTTEEPDVHVVVETAANQDTETPTTQEQEGPAASELAKSDAGHRTWYDLRKGGPYVN